MSEHMHDLQRSESRMALLDRWADDLAVGDRQRTRGRTITEADIVNWCALTGDWFVLHTDAEHASKSVFGERIAPGMMILAYTGGLGVPPATTAVVANYGLDRVRFVAPTFIGDTIHLVAEVSEKRERDDETALVSLDWQAMNQSDELVCSSVLRVLMMRSAPCQSP